MRTKEYFCRYCGSKSSEFCTNCQEKLPLVRDLQTMVRNKVIEVRGKNGIQKKR